VRGQTTLLRSPAGGSAVAVIRGLAYFLQILAPPPTLRRGDKRASRRSTRVRAEHSQQSVPYSGAQCYETVPQNPRRRFLEWLPCRRMGGLRCRPVRCLDGGALRGGNDARRRNAVAVVETCSLRLRPRPQHFTASRLVPSQTDDRARAAKWSQGSCRPTRTAMYSRR
jgi:hypothetical protein